MLYGMSILPHHIIKPTEISLQTGSLSGVWLSMWTLEVSGSPGISMCLLPSECWALSLNLNSTVKYEGLILTEKYTAYYQVLDENIGYEVRWAIAGKSIVTQLVARLSDEQYMAFGLSGDPDSSV